MCISTHDEKIEKILAVLDAKQNMLSMGKKLGRPLLGLFSKPIKLFRSF